MKWFWLPLRSDVSGKHPRKHMPLCGAIPAWLVNVNVIFRAATISFCHWTWLRHEQTEKAAHCSMNVWAISTTGRNELGTRTGRKGTLSRTAQIWEFPQTLGVGFRDPHHSERPRPNPPTMADRQPKPRVLVDWGQALQASWPLRSCKGNVTRKSFSRGRYCLKLQPVACQRGTDWLQSIPPYSSLTSTDIQASGSALAKQRL